MYSQLFNLPVSDIDECTLSPPSCDNSTEVCINRKGSFSCSCRQGYIRQKGECQPKELAGTKKSEKKKKKKKRKGTTEKVETKVHFPWYHLVLPIVLAWLTCRHCQPSLYTSVGVVFIVTATALIGQRVVTHLAGT